MYIIRLRNWVLFNITSPIYGVIYRLFRGWLLKHTKVREVYTPRMWSYRVALSKGFTIYANERTDYEYLQWAFIRISWDAADVYHLYVVPAFKAKLRLKRWVRMHTEQSVALWRMRMHYAYRHSFRSGHGVRSFIDHYTHHPYI